MNKEDANKMYNPVEFGEKVLGLKFSKYQKEIIEKIDVKLKENPNARLALLRPRERNST